MEDEAVFSTDRVLSEVRRKLDADPSQSLRVVTLRAGRDDLMYVLVEGENPHVQVIARVYLLGTYLELLHWSKWTNVLDFVSCPKNHLWVLHYDDAGQVVLDLQIDHKPARTFVILAARGSQPKRVPPRIREYPLKVTRSFASAVAVYLDGRLEIYYSSAKRDPERITFMNNELVLDSVRVVPLSPQYWLLQNEKNEWVRLERWPSEEKLIDLPQFNGATNVFCVGENASLFVRPMNGYWSFLMGRERSQRAIAATIEETSSVFAGGNFVYSLSEDGSFGSMKYVFAEDDLGMNWFRWTFVENRERMNFVGTSGSDLVVRLPDTGRVLVLRAPNYTTARLYPDATRPRYPMNSNTSAVVLWDGEGMDIISKHDESVRRFLLDISKFKNRLGYSIGVAPLAVLEHQSTFAVFGISVLADVPPHFIHMNMHTYDMHVVVFGDEPSNKTPHSFCPVSDDTIMFVYDNAAYRYSVLHPGKVQLVHQQDRQIETIGAFTTGETVVVTPHVAWTEYIILRENAPQLGPFLGFRVPGFRPIVTPDGSATLIAFDQPSNGFIMSANLNF